jgi:putative SOS response-associated peptidase YedK
LDGTSQPDKRWPSFAGIWTNWTSVRKVREGDIVNDIFAFLTTEPNTEVGTIHPKAMPVVLTTPDEIDLDDGASGRGPQIAATAAGRALRIVARGVKEDPVSPAG